MSTGTPRGRPAGLGGEGAATFPQQASSRPGARPNVGLPERAVSSLLGGMMVALGLGRGSVGGALAAVAGGGLLYRGVTGHCPLYETLGVDTAEHRGELQAGVAAHPVETTGTVTIGRPAEELDRLWRDPQTLTRVMRSYAEVTPAGEGRFHWQVRGPLGIQLQWDTLIVEDRPGEIIRWESLAGSDLPNEGVLTFRKAPGDLGTVVKLRLRFEPPAGAIGQAAARLLRMIPRMMADKVLYDFKSLAETGEIPTLERQPAARRDTR